MAGAYIPSMGKKVEIRLGNRDTKLPSETEGGPSSIARKMIRKVGVNKGPRQPKGIGVGKKIYALKNLKSAQW